MKVKPIFVSTSKPKIEEFKTIVNSRFEYSLVNEEYNNLDYPEIIEIQGNIEEVANDKAIRAFQIFKKPVIVDDESLNIVELNGFPGPYLKDFQNSLRNEGMYNFFIKFNCTLISRVIYAVSFDGVNVTQFSGESKFNCIKYRENKEKEANFWEVITHDNINNKRLSELSSSEKNYDWYMRKQAIDKLVDYMNSLKL